MKMNTLLFAFSEAELYELKNALDERLAMFKQARSLELPIEARQMADTGFRVDAVKYVQNMFDVRLPVAILAVDLALEESKSAGAEGGA